jgi:hypothetical protein
MKKRKCGLQGLLGYTKGRALKTFTLTSFFLFPFILTNNSKMKGVALKMPNPLRSFF